MLQGMAVFIPMISPLSSNINQGRGGKLSALQVKQYLLLIYSMELSTKLQELIYALLYSWYHETMATHIL